MKRDLRQDPLYEDVFEHFRRSVGPSAGRLHGAAELAVSPDGERIAFDGPVYEELKGVPVLRIGLVPASGGKVRQLTFGPHSDRLPRWSPDGSTLAFLSDRKQRGRFQLYGLQAGEPGEAAAWPEIEGTIEYFEWSPDGSKLLAQTTGLGADAAGAAGSGTVAGAGADATPSWLPDVEESVPENLWRRVWIVDVASKTVRRVSGDGLTVWEAAWIGNDAIAAIASSNPREGAWYAAMLCTIDLHGVATTVYRSSEQIGVPNVSRDGRYVAFVEACCSDRTVVAGNVLIVDLSAAAGGSPVRVDCDGVDVTALAWTAEGRLLYAGIRSFETVAGYVDAGVQRGREVWKTRESCGGRYPSVTPVPGSDAFVTVLHSYARYPAIACVSAGTERIVCDFADAGSAYVSSTGGTVSEVSWKSRDGLELGGFLVTPDTPGPHPLVVNVHGGPVWAFRNSWSLWYYFTPLFAKYGYATFHPNPRGSSGRGQDFARMVRGDMTGEDTHDIINGVQSLIDRGLVDARRVAVTGGSYGGEMSSWIVTQTDMFAAAMPIAPVTNQFSFQWTTNIPDFNEIFLNDSPYNVQGRYATRSAVLFARNVKTPTLHMAGALDRCTPPTQAMEFHRALVENGVPSELVIYPEEGHGVRGLEARADQTVRMLKWLERYMPAAAGAATASEPANPVRN